MFTNTQSLFSALDDVFSSAFQPESKKQLPEKVTVEVPGFNKDNLNITIKNGYLIVKGENKDIDRKINKYMYIGNDIDIKNTKASVKDGILQIELKEDVSKDIHINIS